MKVPRITAGLAVTALAATPLLARAGTIESELETILEATAERETVSTLVFLADRVDLAALRAEFNARAAKNDERHLVVVSSLQQRASEGQVDLVAQLEAFQVAGQVQHFEAFWISNVVRVDAPPAVIRLIAQRDDVDTVFYNYEIEGIRPVQPDAGKGKALPHDVPKPEIEPDGGVAGPGAEPGLVAIRAPEAWAIGFSGQGMVVANIDTGVAGAHTALAARWKGVSDPAYANNPEWAFHDPFLGQDDFPYDQNGHGTHTMGTIAGGPPGDQIGVAPDAEWIASASIDRGGGIPQTVADAILSFQWIVDPDGNPNTIFDVPCVVSSSWGLADFHGYPDCDETFWEFLDAAEAAGVVVVFAAGNEGGSGLRRPADRATDDYRTYAVAAVNGNVPGYPIASFSSTGPTNCTPTGVPAIKPDISAPGVDVRSASPSGGYNFLSGTSMACPHIAGVVALVRQACPDLTIDDVKQIMFDTAVDLGSAGEDNTYGYGIVDAYEAVQLALGLCGPSPPRAFDGYYETGVDSAVMATLSAIDYDGEPNPVLSYRITVLPSDPDNALVDPGTGLPIGAGELPYTLVNDGNQVQFVPSNGYWGTDTFEYVANDGGVAPDGGDSDPAFVSVLVQFDAPSILTTCLPDGYLNQPYGPVQLAAEQGQPELSWSVGGDLEYEEQNLIFSLFSAVGIAQGWHADDNAWSYALPFSFPYYDNEYTTIYVSSNGLITFGGPNSDWSNSDGELINSLVITALWDDLRTDSGSSDIYIHDSVAGQVTIRWSAVTYSGGNPVNFSVQLFDDGLIRMHYGPGNDPVTPTVGISSGDGTHYVLSQYNNNPSLNAAPSLQVFPPSTLPEALTISPEGVLSGIPIEFGAYTPRIRVTDSLGRTDFVDLDLLINETGSPGDIDGSGGVGTPDLLILLAEWGACAGECPADLDCDGAVGTTDLLILLANWG